MHRRLGAIGIVTISIALAAIPIHAEGEAEGGPPSDFGKAPQLRVKPRNDLRFGAVVPGLPTTVSPLDGNAGTWQLQGQGNATVTVRFPSLPSSIAGNGDQMPVRFAADSAAVIIRGGSATTIVFDPVAGITFTFGNSGNAWIHLGGIAEPRGDQTAGDYSSPITLEAEPGGSS